jgi:TonB family protein
MRLHTWSVMVLLTASFACDKQATSTTPPPDESSETAKTEPAPVEEPIAEEPSEDEELAADESEEEEELTDEELAELEAEMDAEMEAEGGSGGGFGGRGKAVPNVRQATATVEGNLDKDIVRRIVRAHINEVRSCYNGGLSKDATLAGKVTIEFTIAADGSVDASKVADSELPDAKVGECIAKAVKKWVFPKPTGGGQVSVLYPFILEPG